jgi:hypothetical protein
MEPHVFNTREKISQSDRSVLYGAGGEPPGVLGTGVEIGGVSPVLEP